VTSGILGIICLMALLGYDERCDCRAARYFINWREEGGVADVFISYKRERRNAAQHLTRILELNGYSIRFDYRLLSGRDFGPQLECKIRAAKAVLVL
jgi:hypothetical protein